MAQDDMFAGRKFAVPYAKEGDYAAASAARAAMSTRTSTPGMVLQVGDTIVPLGVDPFATEGGPSANDVTTRRLDQLPAFAQDIIRRNIAWQYGAPAPSDGTDDPNMKKGIVARLLGVDHLFPNKKLPARPAPRTDTTGGEDPKRLMSAEGVPGPDAPRRLIPMAVEDGPKRLLNTPFETAMAQVQHAVTPSKPTPRPVERPVDRSVGSPEVPSVTPAPTVSAPASAAAPTVGAAPRVSKKGTPRPAKKPAGPVERAVPRELPERLPLPKKLTREVEPHEFADVSAEDDSSDDGPGVPLSPQHHAILTAMNHFRDLHAMHRPGFTMHAEMKSYAPGEPPRLLSRAEHKLTGMTEEHELIPWPSGAAGPVTHVHRISMPDRAPYEGSTTLPSLDALREHLNKHFPQAKG